MAQKFNAANVDDVVKRYKAGQSTPAIGRALGVSAHLVNDTLRRAGVPLRSPYEGRRAVLDMDAITVAYAKGESARQIGKRFGISDNVIRHRLAERGVALRGRNDYRPHTAEANAAARGRVATRGERERRAKTIERLGSHISPHERVMHRMLDERRVAYVPQKALGIYNLDIALAEVPIAVEVSGGGGKPGRRRIRRQRIEYILDQGICLVEINFPWHIAHVLTEAAADYVVAYADFLRANPSAPREHRMIRSDGKTVACRRGKTNPWPVPPRPVRDLNVTEG